MALSKVFFIREKSATIDSGLLCGASCLKGTKYTPLVLRRSPRFLALAPRASFYFVKQVSKKNCRFLKFQRNAQRLNFVSVHFLG